MTTDEAITLNESTFDGAFVIRERGEPVLPLFVYAEALYALQLAREWHAAGRWISANELERAVREHFREPQQRGS